MRIRQSSHFRRVNPLPYAIFSQSGESRPECNLFLGGYARPQLIPSDKLQAVPTRLCSRHASRALQYTVSDGFTWLRA